MILHIVQSGDTAESIAERYGVSTQRLIYDNQLRGLPYLPTGMAVLVLKPSLIHQVAEGDTAESIAGRYGITEKQLFRNNSFLLNQEYLETGQSLVIAYQDTKLGALRTAGYAYPFIEEALLKEVLLYLNELLIFSYGFTPEGELVPPEIPEDWMIDLAWQMGVRPILVLTPFSEFGVFNNQLVKIVAENPVVQENLIGNLLEILPQKGYAGVDVDFEYILPEDRLPYARFVENLSTAMRSAGFQTSVALAPKTSSGQAGLLYEGMDYGLLGAAADQVLVMTYEWGYTYGPPMAVAPLDKVRQVLNYAVTEIAPEKILMGIPNYGYDWPLPFVRGVTAAELLGNVEAVRVAAVNGAPIQFDETAMSPFFTYELDGISHEVWFEDSRSIDAKLRTAVEYGFLGIGYWNLMRPFRANWMLVNVLVLE